MKNWWRLIQIIWRARSGTQDDLDDSLEEEVDTVLQELSSPPGEDLELTTIGKVKNVITRRKFGKTPGPNNIPVVALRGHPNAFLVTVENAILVRAIFRLHERKLRLSQYRNRKEIHDSHKTIDLLACCHTSSR